MEKARLSEISLFLSDYLNHLLGAGVHTARVVRNTKRLGKALGVNVSISTFQKAAMMTVSDMENDNNIVTKVLDISAFPISFEWNAELSALSWNALDDKLSFEEIKKRFDTIVNQPKMKPALITLLVGFANASFCRLFGGGPWAMLIVFIATLLGFSLRQYMTKKKVNHYIVFIASAFVASFVSSSALFFGLSDAEIALATSVLYLVPGVPLINGVIDITDGHILIGFSRLVNAMMLIVCIAIGMSATLMMFKNSLL